MKKMYFGTREKMQWIKCPATNISRNRNKWQETGAYLNGGAFSAQSSYSHLTYDIAWNLMASEEAAKIMSYYEGVHGDGLIYFLDPFAKKSNVLPLHWSVPRLCIKDAPNLLPAGSARPTGVPATYEIARNLATNPSFEATSGTVEVRRSLFPNPLAALPGAATDFEVRYGWTRSALTGLASGPEGVTTGVRATAPAGVTSGVGRGFDHGGNADTSPYTIGYPVTAGTTYTASSWVRTSAATGSRSGYSTIRFHDGTAWVSPVIYGTAVVLTQGAWALIQVTAIAPAGATRACFRSAMNVVSGSYVEGETFDVAAPMLEAASSRLPFFAPGLPSPDSDLTPSWTGTANASASVLTGVGATGVSTLQPERAVRFSSTQWSASGTRSVRISPRSTDPALTYAEVGVGGLTVGQTYTLLGRIRLASPQTGTLAATARGFWVVLGSSPAVTYLSTAPNAAGEHEVRGTFVATAASHGVRLMNGASVGNGDVWWDDFAIVEGVYTGPWFDGSNTYDPALVPSWTGAANASASILTGYAEGFPKESAQFTVAGTDGTNPTVYIPVPPGENFYLSVRGVASGSAGIRVIPDNGTAVTLAPTSLGTPATTVCTNPGGVTLRFAGTGTFTLNSMRATVGTSAPDYSVFRQGEGNSGVRFSAAPVRTGYSSALDLESVTADFVEVGAWL